jgi:hypothetical protein
MNNSSEINTAPNLLKLENNNCNNITTNLVASNSEICLDNSNQIKKESDSLQTTVAATTTTAASTATTATTIAPYIIQNGNIYQVTSNNQLISRNSIQVNQIGANNTIVVPTVKLENPRQTINLNAHSLLNSNTLSTLNIINTKLNKTTATSGNQIKLTTLKNGTLLNINSLPNGCKSRIIFKTPINLNASDSNNFQLKPPTTTATTMATTTTKQVLVVPNTNNSNILHLQNNNNSSNNNNINNNESVQVMPVTNSNISSSPSVKPTKSPQQTVQYYLSNTYNNNTNLQASNQIIDNKTVTLMPSINTNTLTVPIQQQQQQQQIQTHIIQPISNLNNNNNNNIITNSVANATCTTFVDTNKGNNSLTIPSNMNSSVVNLIQNTDIPTEKLNKNGKPRVNKILDNLEICLIDGSSIRSFIKFDPI